MNRKIHGSFLVLGLLNQCAKCAFQEHLGKSDVVKVWYKNYSLLSFVPTFHSSSSPALRMLLCVIPQMARRTHRAQICGIHVFRTMIKMSNSQRPFVRIKWIPGLSALLPAHLTLPSNAFLLLCCYSLPVSRIPLTFHWHPHHLPHLSTCAQITRPTHPYQSDP